MKNLIRKILKEAVSKDDIVTINGVNFVIGDYISSGSGKKNSDIFLELASNINKKHQPNEETISYEKFLEIKSTLMNAGLKAEPSAYNRGERDKIVRVYTIRVTVDVSKIVRLYLDVVLNTNTSSLFEGEENFEWVTGLDMQVAEKEVKKGFRYAEDYGFSGGELYDMLVEAGLHNPEQLKEIGTFVGNEANTSHDSGYENGRDSCDCDGCCDDYYYEDQVNEIREEEREEGKEEGRQEMRDEIEVLKSDYENQISELQGRIEELESEKE